MFICDYSWKYASIFTSAQVRECILNESGQNDSDDNSPDTDDCESDENNLCIGRPVRNAHGAGFRVCGGGVRTCGGGVRTWGGVRIHEAGGGATAHGGERELSGDKQEGNFHANAPNEMIEQNDAANNKEENGLDEQNEGEMEPQGWVAVDNQTE